MAQYASHSVLANGRWVKIRIPETGIYHLSDDFLREAGFADPSRVSIYGYGGAMQPEKLLANYVADTDDLHEVATCNINDRRLFYGIGPVNWESKTSGKRTRNPYSDYGYYFLTDADGEPLTVDSTAFADSFYPSPNDYNALYEVDDFCWYHGGRNVYEQELLRTDRPRTFNLPAYSNSGILTVVMSYDGFCNADIKVNGTAVGSILINSTTASKTNAKLKSLPDDYSKATADTWTFDVKEGLSDMNTITIQQTSGGKMRLDYIVLTSTKARPAANLSTQQFNVPEVVGVIDNQDLHADPQADMVIIIPANRLFLSEAERLKQLHEDYDHYRVNIVAADQLFNEFASGTPDANAYRRYMKMLYDRAETEDDKPRFLLLFGDGAWENRMCTSNWRTFSPDDFLLCYESENSFSETKCYVSDDYFCLLDDGEGTDMVTDKIDVAVGRFPARTTQEAAILVDKAISYRINDNAGTWQNTICFMGDDGDKNRHMNDAELVAKTIENNYPGYNIKKIYWDAYTYLKAAVNSKYPEVTSLVRQQMQDGALIMNYSGHGSPSSLSHENVIFTADFALSSAMRLPLWVTASCDIMAFDGQVENIGETAIFNPDGGAIAFFGTTRTVYAAWNRPLNIAFMQHVLGTHENGRRITIGEAAMMAKNEFVVGTSRDMIVNKQQFSLLGDPALTLNAPTLNAVIDDVDGIAPTDSNVRLSAGKRVKVNGHIEGDNNFTGNVNLTVRDAEVTIRCRQNVVSKGDTAMVYKTRPNTIFTGTNHMQNGHFTFEFTIPKDISYAEEPVQMLVHAISDDHTSLAHGECIDYSMGGGDNIEGDGVGPIIFCYLENEGFTNGSTVGPTPYFYAMVSDPDGINVSGLGIGHDLELSIDNRMATTFNLNKSFVYSIDDFCTGTVEYTLPTLSPGLHHMIFRAWDGVNNSSLKEYDFYVADQLTADIFSYPSATVHGRSKSGDFFDMQGRQIRPSSGSRGTIVLQRDDQGRVKKMVVGGQ